MGLFAFAVKAANAIGRGAKKFVEKRKAKKQAKIDKRVSSALAKADKQKAALAALGGEAAAEGDAMGLSAAIIGAVRGGTENSVTPGKAAPGSFDFSLKNPIVLVVGVILLLFLLPSLLNSFKK